MKVDAVKVLLGALLLLASSCLLIGQGLSARSARAAPQPVNFRDDDLRAQRIAKALLNREIAQDPSGLEWMQTAWVNLAQGKPPTLLITYGCSPTGNCGLYGFDKKKSGWKLVLNSLAQSCSILSSFHEGRRDISARMHGSATETAIKTYWWRKNRYVRVSVKDVIYR